MKRFRNGLKDESDVHSRLVQAYPEVPHWWFAVIGVLSLVFAIVTIEIFPTEMPIWGLLLAFFLVCFLVLPTGMIQAITNQDVALLLSVN
jgi:hypothetical protein